MKKNISQTKFVKQWEAAEQLGVSYYVLRHAVKRGLIPYYQLGSTRLFKLEDVEAAMQAHRVATTAEVLS
jgi:excisionase family DNA binding protein